MVVWIVCGRIKGGTDFIRVMSIIINDSNSVKCAFLLKSAVSTLEAGKTCFDMFHINRELSCSGNSGKGIINIVKSRNTKSYSVSLFIINKKSISASSKFIVTDVRSTVHALCRVRTKCNDITVSILIEIFIIINVSIDDKSSVRRKLFSEKLERTTDVINILEEIKVVFFDIENNIHCRIK